MPSVFDVEAVSLALATLLPDPARAAKAAAQLRSATLVAALTRGELPPLVQLQVVGAAASGAAAALAAAGFSPCVCRISQARTSADGGTTKLLLSLHDGLAVETVVLRHDSGAGMYAGAPRPGRKRITLCVSSQVGCDMGCTFCATGRQGLSRSLSAAEIVEQVVQALANTRSPISRVVFMGQGEPLNNYQHLCAAVRWLTCARAAGGLGLPPASVTISTVGVVPRMRSLAADLPGVRLALSLHAPTQAAREAIVPSAKTWRLLELLEAAADFAAASPSAPMIEFTLLAGVNDTPAVADELGRLLERRAWTVNLIPYNPPSTSGDAHAAPPLGATEAFQRKLRTEYGINTTVRRTMGQDIGGACGQLAVTSTCTARDIEDLAQA
jgi:adenine C2-methylase RlmN of 23S rRNA A2503 and tRNA A37